jgi:hypothetical protein
MNDERIMAITGNNFQNGIIRGSASYYFSKYIHVWGWATWRRAWMKYNLEISFWESWKKSIDWSNKFTDKVERHYWESIFENTYCNKIDTWDYSWTASIWYNKGLVITPNKNLVSNLGFGIDATHTNSNKNKHANMNVHSLGLILHPEEIIINIEADKFVFNNAYDGRKLRYPYFILVIIKKTLINIFNLNK